MLCLGDDGVDLDGEQAGKPEGAGSRVGLNGRRGRPRRQNQHEQEEEEEDEGSNRMARGSERHSPESTTRYTYIRVAFGGTLGNPGWFGTDMKA